MTGKETRWGRKSPCKGQLWESFSQPDKELGAESTLGKVDKPWTPSFPLHSTTLSHGLGPAQEEHGLHSNIVAGPQGAAARCYHLMTPLAREEKGIRDL